jgi:SAM-dependent methyltransferase
VEADDPDNKTRADGGGPVESLVPQATVAPTTGIEPPAAARATTGAAGLTRDSGDHSGVSELDVTDVTIDDAPILEPTPPLPPVADRAPALLPAPPSSVPADLGAPAGLGVPALATLALAAPTIDTPATAIGSRAMDALVLDELALETPTNRISEIPPEVDPEDLEITEMPLAGRQKPPAPPPLSVVPLPNYARGPDLTAAVQAERAENTTVRRARYWWDEMFGDDFLRTMGRLTDVQVHREVNFIEESLGVQQGAIVLDLACGTGRHAVEMAARGYNVVGYDLSVAMLARAADEAHERNQKLNFLQGDMRDMGFEEMFDAVYCWSTSFGYFDDEKNQLVAHRIHRALRKGGMLLLDVANRDFVAQVQPSLVWFEGEGCVCMDDMRVDFITSRLKVKRMIMMDDGRSRELEYSIRLYTLHELGRMLHDVGFKVTEVSGHLATPRVFMGADSPRLIVLAEKA